MSNDPPPEDEDSEPYFSTDETDETDGSSDVDEFLERFEADQQQSGPESSESRQSDSTERGRLWDSFSSDRSADTDRDRPLTGGGDRSASEPEGGRFGADVTDDWTPQQPSTDDREPSSSSDPSDGSESDSDTDSNSTSFRSILKRISHRISSTASSPDTDSESAAPETQSESSTSPPAESADSTTAAADESASPAVDSPSSADTSPSDFADAASTEGIHTGASGSGSSRSQNGGGPSTDRSLSESASSDAIDEILNNIDLFGRATSSSQVLLLSPTAHSITNDIYRRFLLPADGAGQDILFVSATQSPTDQINAAQEIPNWREGNTAVIEVGQSVLQSSRPATGPDPTRQLDIYKQISNLQHLAKLGINISHIVSQWNTNRRPTVVGVHTLSAVQQYVGNETMFQFLFTLKGQLNSMGVMGFYHMDPAVHTDNEITTIQSAFDLVIRVGPDGSVDIE